MHQIAREIMLLLLNNLHEKSITKRQDRQSFDSANVLFVICTSVATLHSLHEKCTRFSQSEARNFFLCVTTQDIQLYEIIILARVRKFYLLN